MAHCKKAKLNIPMCVACVLFCLTLFSFHLCGGLYARYTARGSASDSARVIKFGELTLTETGDFFQPGKLLIIPGVDLTKRPMFLSQLRLLLGAWQGTSGLSLCR